MWIETKQSANSFFFKYVPILRSVVWIIMILEHFPVPMLKCLALSFACFISNFARMMCTIRTLFSLSKAFLKLKTCPSPLYFNTLAKIVDTSLPCSMTTRSLYLTHDVFFWMQFTSFYYFLSTDCDKRGMGSCASHPKFHMLRGTWGAGHKYTLVSIFCHIPNCWNVCLNL